MLTTRVDGLSEPVHEVRFVHDAKTREARFHLCQAANDGLARVIVGSTTKLGTGVNVQRLAALHHLDTSSADANSGCIGSSGRPG